MHRGEKVQGVTTYLFPKPMDDEYSSFLVMWSLRACLYSITFSYLLGSLLCFNPLFFIAYMSKISLKKSLVHVQTTTIKYLNSNAHDNNKH